MAQMGVGQVGPGEAKGKPGITNTAPAGVLAKSDGTNLVACNVSDDGVTVEIAGGTNFRGVGNLNNGMAFDGTSARVGDVGGGGTGTLVTVIDTTKTITAAASTESVAVDGTAHKITATAASGFIASGTPTNDSAAAGFIGEYLTASRASNDTTSLSTGTAKTITSVNLTAGDWDVWGIVDYVPAATTTTAAVSQGASATDNTLGAVDTFTSCSGGNLTGTALGSLIAEAAPLQRISLAETTSIYLVGKAVFAISTLTAYGSIFARRRR